MLQSSEVLGGWVQRVTIETISHRNAIARLSTYLLPCEKIKKKE
ncbi:hypothetical protein [Sulfurimonas indica]|nr:hypothetical protein [Sulfurimonas indica]